MPYVLTTAPAAEPLSLAEAKLHLRVDITDDDALITSMIAAARMHAEMVTQRQFITATWKLVLDSFPGPSLIGVPWGVPLSVPGHAILLNKSPVASVISIKYLDMTGIQQTMPSTDYTVELSSSPARITPVFGKIWPIPLPQIGAVEVAFSAGYGADGSFVPEGIKEWIKIRINTMYENREQFMVLGRGAKIEPMPFVDGLLDPYRVVTY